MGAKRPRKCQKAATFRPRRLLKPNAATTFRPRRLLRPNAAATFRRRRLLRPNAAATFRLWRLLMPNAAATFRSRRLLRLILLVSPTLGLAVSSSSHLPVSSSGERPALAAAAKRRRVPSTKNGVSDFMARGRLVEVRLQEFRALYQTARFLGRTFLSGLAKCILPPSTLVGIHGIRSLDSPPNLSLDHGHLFRFDGSIHQKTLLSVNSLFSPHPHPVIPQKTVGESDSPTIYCD